MHKAVKKIICLTPVYNDWESFSLLVNQVNAEFNGLREEYRVEIIAVNDGSFDDMAITASPGEIPIEIVSLKNNVGHQSAIAIGLQYINSEKTDFDLVVVLDSDGEDKPQDILKLLLKAADHQNNKIIFAQRKKRQESILFKAGYFFYKYLHYWLTGQKMSFGNFCCIPKKLLKRIVVQENLWIHFSGSIIQSKMPFDKLLLTRGKRYSGHSKMNFTKLILHGLSSISVYFDFLSVRILKLSLAGLAACVLSVLVVLYIKLFTTSAIPGWASNLILLIFNIILQLASLTLIILLMQLSSRKNRKSPSADVYKDFIESVSVIPDTHLSTITK
jgi:polyisoprenyl-phosphate glycosyltransferase